MTRTMPRLLLWLIVTFLLTMAITARPCQAALNEKQEAVYQKTVTLVKSITKSSDSKAKKLKKCMKYLKKNTRYGHPRNMKKVAKLKNWDVTYANDILKRKRGDCVSLSAMFGYMAKACGYKKVRIVCTGSHGYVVIGKRFYAPCWTIYYPSMRSYNQPYPYSSSAASFSKSSEKYVVKL